MKAQDTIPAQTDQLLLPLQVKAMCLSINGKALLSHINLQLEDNGITVIMGHNGAGKSLFIRALHGILIPQSGTVQWNSQPVANHDIRMQQAMVFQKPVLLRRSVAANISYALKLRGNSSTRRRDQLLDAAQLTDKSKQSARSLSGGEQQRLAIARALATNPQVLFLDEPTASLDPVATTKIESLIRRISEQGIKIIMVTHDVAQAQRLAKDIVFLSNGKLAEHTTADRFFRHPDSSSGFNYLSGYFQHLDDTPGND